MHGNTWPEKTCLVGKLPSLWTLLFLWQRSKYNNLSMEAVGTWYDRVKRLEWYRMKKQSHFSGPKIAHAQHGGLSATKVLDIEITSICLACSTEKVDIATHAEEKKGCWHLFSLYCMHNENFTENLHTVQKNWIFLWFVQHCMQNDGCQLRKCA